MTVFELLSGYFFRLYINCFTKTEFWVDVSSVKTGDKGANSSAGAA